MLGSGRDPLIRSTPIIRSYHGESTGSHPNSEVKHHWACSVLRWGTTWESQVTYVLHFATAQGREDAGPHGRAGAGDGGPRASGGGGISLPKFLV